MSKAINAAIIEGLGKELATVESCVVIGTVGMSVADVTGLRTRLRGASFRMRVVKNTLARRSFESRGFKGLGERLKGPSAVVYGGEGATSIARALLEEKKKAKDKLVIHGAYAEGEVLDAAGVEALSRAPSRNDLLAMTLAGLFGPVSEMARCMDGLLTEVHGLIEALGKKKEAEGGGGS